MLKSPRGRARETEPADQQEIIVGRMLPIHHVQPLLLLPAALAVRDRWSASPSSVTSSPGEGEGRRDFNADGEAA